jgi:integrase/recombinase XerD
MLVRKYAEASDLTEKRVNPTTLRHTCAVHMLQRGADLDVVQVLLGHADISTTSIYATITPVKPVDVLEAFAQHHPRAHPTKGNDRPDYAKHRSR